MHHRTSFPWSAPAVALGLVCAAAVGGCDRDGSAPGAWSFRSATDPPEQRDTRTGDAPGVSDVEDGRSGDADVSADGDTDDARDAGFPRTAYCRSRPVYPPERLQPPGEELNPSNTTLKLAWKTRLTVWTPFDDEKYDYQEIVGMAYADDLQEDDDGPVDTLALQTANPDRPSNVPGFVRLLMFNFNFAPGNRRAYSWGFSDPRSLQTSDLSPLQVIPTRHQLFAPLAVDRYISGSPTSDSYLTLHQGRFLSKKSHSELTAVTDVSAPARRDPRATHAAVAPHGVVAAIWQGERIVGVAHDRLAPPSSPPSETAKSSWSVDVETLWPNASDTVQFDWMRLVAPRTLLVRARDRGDPNAADRLYRLNPCRPTDHSLVLEAVGIGPEAMKTDDGYILRVGRRSAGPRGSEPVHVRNGQIRHRLGERCRKLTEWGGGKYLCARPDDNGMTWYRFAPEMDDPYIGGSGTEAWRLQVLGAPGPAMVFLGVRERNSRARVVVAVRYRVGWRYLDIQETSMPAGSGRPRLQDAPAILTDDGELVFAAEANGSQWLFGVETHLDGLYGTRYPRTRRGGNHGRGWARVGR